MRTRIIGILSTEHTEDTDHRKLSTELFFGSLRLEILGEIFNEIWPLARNQSSDLRRNLYGNKIFKKILTENAQQYVALLEGFIMDRLTGSTS